MIPGIKLENGFSPITVYIEPHSDGGWQGAVAASRRLDMGVDRPTKIEYASWYFRLRPEDDLWTCTSGEYFDSASEVLIDYGRKVRNVMGSTTLAGFRAERSD